ncbi:hypothetical protein QF035_008836 [Streptomyces umbrinus]|uniref:Uncharacterized protein n=2 Tax=Streptomyces umbrinus TaxID=67370 RepID=A0ABU0T8V9_9ACTN|nr:hypothetical protein [Streptomyces umbrinus]
MFGDDMPMCTRNGVRIVGGMQLHNTYDNEPVTVTSGTDCARHRSTPYRRPGADGITRPTRSVHANGTDRYVNEWEGYHHVVVRTGPTGVCRYVHASELTTEEWSGQLAVSKEGNS